MSEKSKMNCGQVKPSTRPGKKVMKKYCINGKEKLIHAGDKNYKHNYSEKANKNFRKRHNCIKAKPGTPKHLACTELWPAR